MTPRPSEPPCVRPEPTFSDRGSARLLTLAQRELGVEMPASKLPMLRARLSRRIRELGLGSAESYWDQLVDPLRGPRELSHFLDLVTTHVTSFFREAEQLELLRGHLVEIARRAHAERREVRIWSAACSRGHEVWTLAMMLAELGDVPCSLLGSDVSAGVIEEAMRAVYPERELESVPAELCKRYFLRSRDRTRSLVRVVPELRQRARFGRVNLMAPSYELTRDFDVVLLRNVLIYFASSTQAEVAAKVARHLRPGGLLCVGLSESLHGHSLPLEHLKLGIYRYQAGGR